MRMTGKGFSSKVTPLFQTMVQQWGEGSTILPDPQHTPTIIQPSSSQPQKAQKPRKPTKKDTHVSQPSGPTKYVVDEVVHKELGDRLVRSATTASSLDAKQDSGNITKTQSNQHLMNLVPKELIQVVVPGNTLQSDVDSLKLGELMALCTTLQNKVLDLEKTTTTQCNKIASLKKRIQKLKKKNRSRTHRLKRLYKVGLSTRVESSSDEEILGEDASKHGRIDAIDADEEKTLVSATNNKMFDVDVLGGEEVFVAGQNENVVKEVVDAAQRIDMACEEYSQEVLGNSEFLLEEVDAFLALEDDPTSPEVDQSYFDSKGDILLLEAFLNEDPSLPPSNQGNYLPQVHKELKICEAKSDKSSIDEPPEVELKDLPPYLEYAFLEGDDKLPVIIAKYLSVEEKTALITVLKSHKRAIAWKLSDIKGIDPEFYTHNILIDEDFEPAVQHQRRVNPKIYDVIKI
nr:reverse transcriptase domain-containing protein [Tanacetum cinerariifolium]